MIFYRLIQGSVLKLSQTIPHSSASLLLQAHARQNSLTNFDIYPPPRSKISIAVFVNLLPT